MFNDIGDTTINRSTIVFFFGQMTENARRTLARECRERGTTVIVLDDVLMFYLASARESRLPSMLRCTLPFTYYQPYTSTPGRLPDEMFFGRAKVMQHIKDSGKNCMIYGGRQLGKTVLLRRLARTLHNPNKKMLAVFIDLKHAEIGVTRPLDYIWQLLYQELKDFGIFPSGRKAPRKMDAVKFVEYVREWILADGERRIWVLFDEADVFLYQDGLGEGIQAQSDADKYQNSTQFNGLMSQTEGRFTVVFAGLHDVQRTATASNNPLVQLGANVFCIGPLFEDGEVREARKLIEKPLSSLGYRFESEDLVWRILNRTNYYPSLIQLYCTQLLEHVIDTGNQTWQETEPPYVITDKHVEEAYRNKDLVRRIRERFIWTLELDQRYEVIACVIAEKVVHAEAAYHEGFLVPSIKMSAKEVWPEGFEDTTDIKPLLEEMEGLGVLRKVSSDSFTLRSPNVLLLLGTEEEIAERLNRQRALPPTLSEAVFRSRYRDTEEKWFLRSPLTSEQESRLRSVAPDAARVIVIVGSKAAAIQEVGSALHFSFGGQAVRCVDPEAGAAGFKQALENLRERPLGTTLLLVPETVDWDEDWIERALDRFHGPNALYSEDRQARVLFVAGPEKTQFVVKRGLHRRDHGERPVRLLQLRPWDTDVLWAWMDDCGLGAASEEDRALVKEATGNWPMLLACLHETCKREHMSWRQALTRLKDAQENPAFADTIASMLGIDQHPLARILYVVAEGGDAFAEDAEDEAGYLDLLHAFAIDEIPDVTTEGLSAFLQWAELLSLVNISGELHWSTSPLVTRLMKPDA